MKWILFTLVVIICVSCYKNDTERTLFFCDQYYKYIDYKGDTVRIDTIPFSFNKTHSEMDTWINDHVYTIYDGGYKIESSWSCGEAVCIKK